MECFLTSDRVKDKKKLCEIACQEGNDTSTCKSTSELKHIFGEPVFMRPGAPCNNFQVRRSLLSVLWILYDSRSVLYLDIYEDKQKLCK